MVLTGSTIYSVDFENKLLINVTDNVKTPIVLMGTLNGKIATISYEGYSYAPSSLALDIYDYN